MAAGIGSMNFYYQRHDDDNSNPVQPPNAQDATDPGFGWSNLNYRNFNRGYIRYGDVPGSSVPQPAFDGGDYVRYEDVPGSPAPQPAPYLRHDNANVGYSTNPPPIPNQEP